MRLVGLLLAVILSGCAADDDGLVFEDDSKADDGVRRPFGTWRRELGSGDAGFNLLVLKTDRTFHYAQELVTCEPGKCTDELSGRYRFATSNGRRYVVLFNDDAIWYSFEYRMGEDDGELQLAYAGSGFDDPFTLELGEGWCQAVTDCELQNIPQIECVGGHFVCSAESTCEQACGR